MLQKATLNYQILLQAHPSRYGSKSSTAEGKLKCTESSPESCLRREKVCKWPAREN